MSFIHIIQGESRGCIAVNARGVNASIERYVMSQGDDRSQGDIRRQGDFSSQGVLRSRRGFSCQR